MFDTLKRLGRMKIPVSVMVAVFGLMLMAGALMAATGSATVDFLARTLWVKAIKPVRVSGTATNWMTIGDSDRPNVSGVTVVGDVVMSGVTAGPFRETIAYLGGTTGTVTWTYQSASGVSPSLTTQAGNSGWFLTLDQMRKYRSFYVDPSGGTAGASPYTHAAPMGVANTGATIYLSPSLLTAETHGMVWTFTNHTGTTAFYIYSPWGRINGGAGTTQCPAGQSTIAQTEDAGDSVEVQAVFTPTAVSGWYVRHVYVKD